MRVALVKISDILSLLPGRPQKEFHVTETEWYDRILFALEWLCKRPGVREEKLVIDGEVVSCTGNDPQAHEWLIRRGSKASKGAEPVAWAYFFNGVKDQEYLRRLNEYPDETAQADLEAPFVICCEDTSSFITINARF